MPLYILFTHQQMYFYYTWKSLNLHENNHNYRSYMFRSSPSSGSLYRAWLKLLTYLLHGAESFLRRWTVNFAASQEIPRIYGTRKFLTVPTSARHPSLSWDNSVQSPRHPPTSWRSILILSSHIRLGLPNGLFLSDFPTNTLCPPYSSPIRVTCPAPLIRFDFTIRTILGKE